MPETLHRGPRYVQAEELPATPASRVLMPELLGRVLYLARRGVEGSQAQVADLALLPPSTVSKLELGLVSAAVHHLDALADAYTQIAALAKVPSPTRWQGWELFHATALLATALEAAGYTTIWDRADLVAENDPLYVRGRDLSALVRQHWPTPYRGRA